MITKQFILAGKAVFTVEIPASYGSERGLKGHYTFKVCHKEASAQYPEAWFVNLLTGPDNTSDYTYFGMLRPADGQLDLTAKSHHTESSKLVAVLRRVLARVWAGEQDAITAAGFNLHHEGKCCRCGRILTTPESVTSGIGPECAKKLGV